MTREEHLLTIAAEECAEIAQRCSKANRFGLEQIQQDADDKPEENPERLTNLERIRREYEDLAAMMELIGIVTLDRGRIDAKQRKVERYLRRSESLGKLAHPVSGGRYGEEAHLSAVQAAAKDRAGNGER